MTYSLLHEDLRTLARNTALSVNDFFSFKTIAGYLVEYSQKWPGLIPPKRPEFVVDHSGKASMVWSRDADNYLILDLIYGGISYRMKLNGEVEEGTVIGPQKVLQRFIGAGDD